MSLKKIINIISKIIFYLTITFLLSYSIISLINPKITIKVFRYQHFVIQTNSMAPNINAGDIVIVKNIDLNNLKENDIITFYVDFDLDGKKEIVTHYFVKTEINSNNEIIYRTRSEGKTELDSWQITEDDIIGVYVRQIKKLGKLVLFSRSPIGILVILIDIGLIYLIIKTTNEENFKEKEEEDLKNLIDK